MVEVDRQRGDDLDGETLLWMQVGPYQRDPYDACSPACASALITRVRSEHAELITCRARGQRGTIDDMDLTATAATAS
jgi:hypothetical protein